MSFHSLMRGVATVAVSAVIAIPAMADNHGNAGGTLVIGSTQVPRHLNGAVQSGIGHRRAVDADFRLPPSL